MTLLRNIITLYRRNLFLTIFTSLLFVAFLLGMLVYYFAFRSVGLPPIYLLQVALLAASLLPMIFIFLSYEYGYRLRASNLDECLGAVPHGKLKLYGCQALVLTSLAALLTVILFAVQLFIYIDLKLDSPAYLWHVAANLVLNIFLASFVGIMVGLAASVRLKRINAYLLLVAFAVLAAGVLNKLFVGLYNDTGVDAFYFLDLFTINAPSLGYMPNAHFGYSLLSYQYQQVGFWVFGALAVGLFGICARKKSWQRGVAWACIAASVTCLVFYAQPASKVNMMLDHPHGSNGGRQYYSKQDVLLLEEDGGFNITNYQLQFTPGRELKAKAVLTVDQPDLAVYKFTLFHGYRVQSVQDQAGNDLAFEQKGDYITVQRGSAPVTQVQMKYQGYNKPFYANRQGVFLPPQAAFYPYSGYHTIINEDRQEFVPVRLPADTEFSVQIKTGQMKTGQKVYSNLTDKGDGLWEGPADSLILMSGFVTDMEVEGVQVVYPYLDTAEYAPQLVENCVKAFLAAKQDDRTFEQIFVTPNVNTWEKFTVMGDYFTAEYLFECVEGYERALIPQEKLDLFDTLTNYKKYPDIYQKTVDIYRENAGAGRNIVESVKRLLLFDDKIKQLGEATVLAQCNQYLSDNHDTRSIMEFLQSLQQ